MTVEIIMAEAGPTRGNAGDGNLPEDRLEPSLSSFRKHFPEAKFTVYTDQPWSRDDGVEVRVVKDIPLNQNNRRYPWRFNDYFEARGLLDSKADVCIAADSDLVIVNRDVRTILPMTERFKLCMPSNGRRIVWRDAVSDCDGGKVLDETKGMGPCRCTAFWAFRTNSEPHRRLLEAYCDQVVSDARDNRGARGPLSLWRAEWATGISPWGLPAEWCITGSTTGNVKKGERVIPVILHAGHKDVLTHYADLIARQK